MTAIWNKKVREADFPRNDICFDRADSSSYKHRIGFQKSHDGEEPVHDAYQDDREDARLHTDYCGDVAEDPSGGSDSDMEFSEDESIDNADMTPLQYARHYGLTVDYFQQAPLHPSLLPSPPDSMLGDLDDHELAPYIDLKAFDREAMHERWALDKGTAELLGSVMALSSHCEINDGPAGASRSTELEMEEAILSSDPEIDVLNFRARNFVSISTKGVEPFRLVVDKDESLDDWATQDLTLPAVKMQDICKAELDIDRDVVNLLREVFKPSNMDRSDMVEVALEAEKAGHLRHDTPPLMPLSSPRSLQGMPDDACQMEFTSTPEDLIAEDVAHINADLLAEDETACAEDASPSTLDALAASEELRHLMRLSTDTTSSPLRRKRLHSLKAEVPLTPQDAHTPPFKKLKVGSFPEEMETLIPRPESGISMLSSEAARQEVDDFVADVVRPRAQSVIRVVNNEQLDELDTTLRVHVPHVDTFAPTPPWLSSEGNAANHQGSPYIHGLLLQQIDKELLKDVKKWTGLSKLERSLPWSPFPKHLGYVGPTEDFDDGSCARYMADLSLNDNLIDVDPLLWKMEGLRILDPCDSDGEELEEGVSDPLDENGSVNAALVVSSLAPGTARAKTDEPFPDASPTKAATGINDMQALLRKRKLELEAARQTKHCKSARVSPNAGNRTSIDANSSTQGDFGLGQGGLAGFMGLQGKAMPRKADTTAHRNEIVRPVLPQATTKMLPQAPENLIMCPSPAAPRLIGASRPMAIVVSSSFLASRQISRHLQTMLPNLEMIERKSSSSPHANKSQPSTIYEADLTVSPSTGVLCTTLQKLKQKPLPGQSNFFGVHDRVASVCPRYEHLIVLVSESCQDSTTPPRPLDVGDANALSELIGHAANLDSDVEVRYVAGGKEQLTQWIAACICRQTPIDKEAQLLHDETMWERLLRTAGANASAAQFVLAALKRPVSREGSQSSIIDSSSNERVSGLAAFLQMSIKERLQMFGPSLGGDRVLRRVSGVLDRSWTSTSVRDGTLG